MLYTKYIHDSFVKLVSKNLIGRENVLMPASQTIEIFYL